MSMFENILIGEDFKDRRYYLTSLEKSQEVIKDPVNMRFFINVPIELIPSDSRSGYSGKHFKEVRAIYIDIDPSENKKDILNAGGDFATWNEEVLRQIDGIKELFDLLYNKQPTMIINSGKGIQIVLELTEPISKFDVETLKKYTFIFRLLDTVLTTDFEIDKAMYKMNVKNAFNNLAIKRAKLPVKQKIIKYKGDDKSLGVKYETEVFYIDINETTFDLNELLIKDKEYLMDNISFEEGEGKEILFKDAMEDVIAEIRQNYLPKKGYERDDKIMGVRCLFPDHRDTNPSGVFFKDSGVFFCSTCNKGIPFKEVFKIIKGEELKIHKTNEINFIKISDFLTKYSLDGKSGEILYCFNINDTEQWIALEDWTESKLRSFCAKNNITGYKDKLKQEVLDALTKKKLNREIPVIKTYSPQINEDLIILGKNRCFVNSEAGWRKNFSIDVSGGFKYSDEEFTEQYKQSIYNKLFVVNKPHFNLFAMSIVMNSLMMSVFEKYYRLHPITYLYGVKDTGKSSLVNLALSMIVENYDSLVSGASTEHTLLFFLMNKEYIPVLVDEFMKYTKIMDKVIQMLKDIATSGGKYIKGTVSNKEMLNEYQIKANPILVSEYREDSIDPSFYQRCIEINLNMFEKIDSKKTIPFNELLMSNKTFILNDILSHKFERIEEDYIINKYPLFNDLTGKKRLSVFLQVTSLYNSYLFLKKMGVDYSKDIDKIIESYIQNEATFNSKESRSVSVSDQCMLTFISNLKFNLGIIVASVRILAGADKILFQTNRGVLIQLGFRNEHKLNEVAVKPSRQEATLRKTIVSVNVEFEVGIQTYFDFIRMIMENDRDGNYGRAISRNLAEIKIDLKISDEDFINEMGQTMFDSLPQKAKGKYNNLKVI